MAKDTNNKKKLSTKSKRDSFDYDKLAEAIVKAEIKANENLKNMEKEEDIKKLEEWRLTTGYNPGNKLSYITSIFKLMFVKKKDIKDDRTTLAFIKVSTEVMILIGECFLYLFCVANLCIFINPSMISSNNYATTRISTLVMAIPVFVFARMLRISRFEIDNMENKDHLNAIVGSFMGVIGTIIALISLFRGQ